MADEQESMEDILDCFEDTLENMTAERCLKISTEKSDVLEMLAEGAICLTEAKANATDLIATSLGLESPHRAVRAGLAASKYQGPAYRHCQGDSWLCYARACAFLLPASASSVPVPTLLAVMDCAKERADTWIHQHISLDPSVDLLAGNLVLVDALV